MAERVLFRDRADAGRQLAAQLAGYRGRPDVLVLALPRGGVPVAAEVAGVLGGSLDVFLVRKLGVPFHRELAMGAIAEGDTAVLSDDVVRALRIPPGEVDRVVAEEQAELADASASIAARILRRMWTTTPRSSLTMAWPPGRRWKRPSSPCESSMPRASSSRCPSGHASRVPGCVVWPQPRCGSGQS
jgi:hypothetical protein